MTSSVHLRWVFVCTLVICWALQRGDDVVAGDSQHTYPSDASTADEETYNMLMGQLTGYGIDLTPDGLLAGLKHKEAAARAACLNASRWVLAKPENLDKVPAMVPAIAELCQDPVPFVRVQALRTLHAVVSGYVQAKAERIWQESELAADRIQAAVLLNELGDPSHYEVVMDALQDPGDSMFVQAVRSVPGFAERRILKADGQAVDWESKLRGLLLREDVSSTRKLSIASALQQIGSAAAIAAIREASEKEQDPDLKHAMEYLLGDK